MGLGEVQTDFRAVSCTFPRPVVEEFVEKLFQN